MPVCAVQLEDDDDWEGDLRGSSHTSRSPLANTRGGDLRSQTQIQTQTQGIMRKPVRPSDSGAERKSSTSVQIMTPRTMDNSRSQKLSTSDLSYGNSPNNFGGNNQTKAPSSNVIMQYSYSSNAPPISSRLAPSERTSASTSAAPPPRLSSGAKSPRSGASPTFGRTSSGKQPTVSIPHCTRVLGSLLQP